MANQTLTTGTLSSRINYDGGTLSGLANGETITINGGHLLIDGDVRWGYNAAVFDSMTISATLGGSVLIDGTQVWEVPFSASTGNVPAAAAVGSNAVTGSGITGELLSVFATGALAPTAAAAAMSSSGYIKVKGKTGGDFAAGALTGIGASATGADRLQRILRSHRAGCAIHRSRTERAEVRHGRAVERARLHSTELRTDRRPPRHDDAGLCVSGSVQG